MCMKIQKCSGTHRIPEADDFTLRALTENLSLMAVDPVLTTQMNFHMFSHDFRLFYWLSEFNMINIHVGRPHRESLPDSR